MGDALGWERFARARAHLDAGLDFDTVLGAESVDATTWIAEEESLLARLADEVEQGDFAAVEAYRRVYRTTWIEVTGLAANDGPPGIVTSLDTAGMAPSLLAAPPQDGPSCSPSPAPMNQPIDTMPMAPGLVFDKPLPFQPAASLCAAPPPVEPIADVTLMAPGLVIDEPLPFRPAEPPTLPLTPGLSSAPRLTRGK